jgi:hypothetical protein
MRPAACAAVLALLLAGAACAQEYTKSEGGRTYRCYEDPSPNIGEWCWEVSTPTTVRQATQTTRGRPPSTTLEKAAPPGPGNSKCDPEVGETCRTSGECPCLAGQTCDPGNPKAKPGGCVSPYDAISCPENAVAYGTGCVCREGFAWKTDRSACVRGEGSPACRILSDCPGHGRPYCDGNRLYQYACWSSSLGCQRQTVEDCSASGKVCFAGACDAPQAASCNRNGVCETGENCAGCGDCSCEDLQCQPGNPGASSRGCFDPCLDVDNGYYDKAKDGCECMPGYGWDGERTDCVSKDACAAGSHTEGGRCVCDRGYGDCDGKGGCEASLVDDPRNCGGCGARCGLNAVCRDGKCSCPNGYVKADSAAGQADCALPGCVLDEVCDTEDGEDCRGCGDCGCSDTQMCNAYVSQPSTDAKGCRDCRAYCRLVEPNMVFSSSDGFRCECECREGLIWSIEDGGCTDGKPDWNRTMEKVEGRQPLDPCEFIQYVSELESRNRRMGWRQIASQLHHAEYGYDTTYPIMGVQLFRDGAENEGFSDIEVLGSRGPKYVVTRYGEKIDMAHSYTGIRAGLNRWRPTSWIMAKVNTDWGDRVQVLGDRIVASTEMAGGALGMAKDVFWDADFDGGKMGERLLQMRKGAERFDNAVGYRPLDQVRGNELGMDVRAYLLEHPEVKLSEAYRQYFSGNGDRCD